MTLDDDRRKVQERYEEAVKVAARDRDEDLAGLEPTPVTVQRLVQIVVPPGTDPAYVAAELRKMTDELCARLRRDRHKRKGQVSDPEHGGWHPEMRPESCGHGQEYQRVDARRGLVCGECGSTLAGPGTKVWPSAAYLNGWASGVDYPRSVPHEVIIEKGTMGADLDLVIRAANGVGSGQARMAFVTVDHLEEAKGAARAADTRVMEEWRNRTV